MSDEQVPQNNPYYPPVSPAQFYPPPMSVKDWLVTLLLLAIPLVNMVLLIIWAFGDNANINKKNFSKAYLILMLIMMAIAIIAVIGLFFLIAIAGRGAENF